MVNEQQTKSVKSNVTAFPVGDATGSDLSEELAKSVEGIQPARHPAKAVMKSLADHRKELDADIKEGKQFVEVLKANLNQWEADVARERIDREQAIAAAAEKLDEVIGTHAEVVNSIGRLSAVSQQAKPAPKPVAKRRVRKAVAK